MDRPVLLCYDRSRDARRAIEQAARLFAGRPAIVLHVWEPVPEPGLSDSGGRSPARAKDAVAQLNAFARQVAVEIAAEGAGAAAPLGLRADPLAEGYPERVLEQASGGVAATITRVADERQAAAVVLGSRGRSADSEPERGIGSVAFAVLRDSRQPVLLVPASRGE